MRRQHVEAQNREDASETLDGDPSLAPLEPRDLGLIDTGTLSQIALGEAQLFAGMPNPLVNVRHASPRDGCLPHIMADVQGTCEAECMPIAQLLHDARVASGISQRRLSEATGLDQGMISNVERGRRTTAFENVDTWLAACGMRLTLAPLNSAVPEEIAALDTEQRGLLLRLARVLPSMPTESRLMLEDQVDLWMRRYGLPGPAGVVEPSPDITAARAGR